MTQDEIIRMAREAGAEATHYETWGDVYEFDVELLERFAALVEQAEQEPVFISNEQFRSMHFSKVTIYTQNDGKEVIVCTPIRTHIEGFWCEDLTCAKCYSAEFRLKHTAPVRTKDLTDDEIATVYEQDEHHHGEFNYRFDHVSFARAVIAADREKNK